MAPADDKGTVFDLDADYAGSGNSSPSEGQGQVTPNLVIPEARDGFFGYNEEKSLQHVSARDF